MIRNPIVHVMVFVVLLACNALAADPVIVVEALVLPGYDGYRSAGHADPVELAIVSGAWTRPVAGEVVAGRDTTDHRWKHITAGDDGWLADDAVRGGYVYVSFDSAENRVVILEAMAHRMVYVNGVPRTGNLYQYKETFEAWEPRFDYSLVPIWLNEGTNDLLFLGGRAEGIKVRIRDPRSQVFINERDVTLPDMIAGARLDDWAAVTLVNATRDLVDGLKLVVTIQGEAPVTFDVPRLQPLSVYKMPFRLAAAAAALPGERTVTLALTRDDAKQLDARHATLQIKTRLENQRHTFVSGIDGSVQYYGLNPAQRADSAGAALVLSVHGASVEAINESGAYGAKSWGHIVAPTNRRPYGFNWEDWGRIDALETLDVVMATLDIDRSRVYLTGHSMGGHGTWHLGALYPDRFAALGPSAGWISFWSYRPGRAPELTTPIDEMLMRATSPSHTMELAANYDGLGVYVLHGADDDNVPVTESRQMVAHLETFHKDFVYHEEPDAGHWWDKSDEDGADCVDWAPMFDFFVHHRVPANSEIRRVRFRTPSPGVSSRRHWLTIEAQTTQFAMSTVDIRYDPGKRRFVGETDNVTRMTFDLAHVEPGGAVMFELDGQTLSSVDYPGGNPSLTLRRSKGRWTDTPPAPPTTKGPRRYGALKSLFDHHVVLVYGSKGTEVENRWAFARARYDAETFWYYGNGSIEVVRDVDFDKKSDPDRNVILYGNENTNAAWSLLGKAPVRLRAKEIRVGKKKFKGDDLGLLVIRPRRGSDVACVGAIGGTGIAGMRLTDRRPLLQPGFAYPDLVVLCPPDEGDDRIVCGAGFFGLDWRVKTGEFVWSEMR